MKAILNLEYIGEAQDARLAFYARLIDQIDQGLGGAVVGPSRPRKPWVAEILGSDSIYRLKRRFVPANWSRKYANGAHSRGVVLWFVLKPNTYYEVKSPTSWRSHDRYFCRVNDDGEILKISREEVVEWARNR